MKTHKFARLTNFTGRNGLMKCSGIEALKTNYQDGAPNNIILSPLTSRNEVGRCDIFIPIEDVVSVCKTLLLVAGEDLPEGVCDVTMCANDPWATASEMQKMTRKLLADYGYAMLPGWESFGEMSPPDQLSSFTCRAKGALPGDDPGVITFRFSGHTYEEALSNLEGQLH